MNDIAVLLVEDKGLLAEDIKDRLEAFGYRHILGAFAEAESAWAKTEEEEPKIAILDINLKGEMDGIALANRLRSAYPNLSIIFLTQLEDDASLERAAATQPVAYLNKPFTNNELKMAMLNAVKKLDQAQMVPASDLEVLNDRVFVRNGRGKVQVMLQDILWIQSGGGETSAITTKDRLNVKGKYPYTVSQNLNKLEKRLAFEKSLIRCSRFHIVNVREVDRILDDPSKQKNKKLLHIHGEDIPVGDKYRKQVMDLFHII